MVEDVGGLVVDAVVGLLACGAGDLLGLLLDLLADERRVVEQLRGVGALGALAPARRRTCAGARAAPRAARGGSSVAVVEAGALARVAGRAGGLDEREQRVAVAVDAQRADLLDVAGRRALVPQLVAGAAPQMQLAGLAGPVDGLGVGVGEHQDLAAGPVLDHDGYQPALVEGDLHPRQSTSDGVQTAGRVRGAPSGGPAGGAQRQGRAQSRHERAAPGASTSKPDASMRSSTRRYTERASLTPGRITGRSSGATSAVPANRPRARSTSRATHREPVPR